MSEPRPPDRPFRKNGRNGPNGGMRVGRGLFGWVLFISLAIMLVMLLRNSSPTPQPIHMSDFETLLANNRVEEFTIDGNEVEGIVKEGVQIPGASSNSRYFKTEYPEGTFSNGTYLAELMKKRGDAAVPLRRHQGGHSPRVERFAVEVEPLVTIDL